MQKSFILAIEVNIVAKTDKLKKNNNNKNQNRLGKTIRDLKKSIYYNYNKNSHFAKSCLEFSKN